MTDTPETQAVLDTILDRDDELSERNAPSALVNLSRRMERSRDSARRELSKTQDAANKLAALLEEPMRIGGMDWPPNGWCEDVRKALSTHEAITTP